MDECHQVGWLDHGKLVKVGAPGDVVSAYLEMVDSNDNTLHTHDNSERLSGRTASR